jgi:hypothetical protein
LSARPLGFAANELPEKAPVTNGMNRDKAYDTAVKMFQLEAERWAKNALGLLAAIVAIFAGYAELENHALHLGLGWPFLLTAIVSAAAVAIALSIRGTTDAWKKTIQDIDNCQADQEFKAYEQFEKNLDPAQP